MTLPALVLHLSLLIAPPERVSLLEAQSREYFAGEKAESYVWAGMGLVGAGTGTAFLLASPDPFRRGAAIPLLSVGLLQLALGAGLFFRTDPQVARLMELLHADPLAFQQQESTRMEQVNAGFRIYRPVEVLVLVAGVGGLIYGGTSGDRRALGVGAGLSVEAAAMLALDFFADRRAELYARRLAEFVR